MGEGTEIVSVSVSSTDARISVVENRMSHIEGLLGTLTTSINGMRDTLAGQHRPLPFKEIIVSIAATVGILATGVQFVTSLHTQSNAVMAYRVQQLENQLSQRINVQPK